MFKFWVATCLSSAILMTGCGQTNGSTEDSAVAAQTETRPAWPHPTLSGLAPIVIAHRGASGLRPEHTISAYELAVEQGADCIEPDLVVTKDGVLVDRHDIYLSTTTDVADHPEFADRKRPAPDAEHAGRTDWWVADFTLAELKTLRARQPFAGRSTEFDGMFDIPTFDEVIDVAYRLGKNGLPVCIYPEAKAPAYHASLGFDMADMIDATLKAKWINAGSAKVYIQSFEPAFVKQIHARNTGHEIIMLAGDQAGYDAAMSFEGAPFWDGAGVTHAMLFNPDGSSSGFLEQAHAAGIAVHTWTYRDDAPFGGAPIETSIRAALNLGLDGFFTDFPATGRAVVTSIATATQKK